MEIEIYTPVYSQKYFPPHTLCLPLLMKILPVVDTEKHFKDVSDDATCRLCVKLGEKTQILDSEWSCFQFL